MQHFENKYNNLIENLHNGVIVVNNKYKIDLINTFAAQIFGCEKQDLINKNIINAFEDEIAEFFSNNIEKSINEGKEIKDTIRLDNKKGVNDLQTQFHPIYSHEELISGIQIIITDITETNKIEEKYQEYKSHLEEIIQERTSEFIKLNETLAKEIEERKLIEVRLRESEFKFRTLADFTYDLEFWLDEYKQIVYISPSAGRITGYSAFDFKDNNSLFFDIIHPDYRSLVYNQIDKGLEGLVGRDIDYKIIAKSGIEKWVSLVFFPIINLGNFLGIRGNIREITERKATEEKLRQTEIKLKEQLVELEKQKQEAESTNSKLLKINDEMLSTNERLFETNEKLNETREFQKTLLDTIPHPIYYKNHKGKYIDCNKAFEVFLGIDKKDIIGNTPFGFFPKIHAIEDQKKDKELLNKVKNTQQYESELIHKGKKYTVIYDKGIFFDNDKMVSGIIGSILDISELRAAEEKLKLLKDQLELSMNAGNISWWTWMVKENTVTFDNRLMKLLGYTPDEIDLTSYPFKDLIHPEDKEFTINVMDEHLKGNTSVFEIDYRIKTKYGNYKWFYDVGKIGQLDENKNPEMINGIIMDVTGRKKANEALKENEEKIRSIIEQSTDGITLTDNQGRIIEWNESHEKLTGISKSEVIDRNILDVFLDIVVKPQRAARQFSSIRGNIEKALKTGQSKYFNKLLTNRIKTVDNKIRHIQTVVFPIRYKKGYMLGAISRDITEIIKNEMALKESRKQLHEMNIELEQRIRKEVQKSREKDQLISLQSRQAAMGEMIGNIAHQWRQPLNTIGMMVQNLEEAFDFNELTKEMLSTKVKAMMDIVKYMSRTIDDFRNFFKTDKQKQEFRLKEVIDKSLEIISASFKNKNINIIVKVPNEISIKGLPNELSQVIFIILNNAKDAILGRKIKNGNIIINGFQQSDKTILTITDNAGGIDKEIIAKIFDPYFTTKPQSQGTGIGLYMSKVIIEKNMNGKLSVKNVTGGAEFRIEF